MYVFLCVPVLLAVFPLLIQYHTRSVDGGLHLLSSAASRTHAYVGMHAAHAYVRACLTVCDKVRATGYIQVGVRGQHFCAQVHGKGRRLMALWQTLLQYSIGCNYSFLPVPAGGCTGAGSLLENEGGLRQPAPRVPTDDNPAGAELPLRLTSCHYAFLRPPHPLISAN